MILLFGLLFKLVVEFCLGYGITVFGCGFVVYVVVVYACWIWMFSCDYCGFGGLSLGFWWWIFWLLGGWLIDVTVWLVVGLVGCGLMFGFGWFDYCCLWFSVVVCGCCCGL